MQSILIVGIGNIILPRTRHSVGHYILDSIAFRCGFELVPHERLNGYFAQGTASLNKRPVELSLFKPKPLMNILGKEVAKACQATVETPLNMIVIQDHMYLEPGKLKVKFGGSPENHRGIRSINKAFGGDPDYFRLQVGIGRAGNAAEWVLGPLSGFERQHWSSNGEGMDDVWSKIEQIEKRMT